MATSKHFSNKIIVITGAAGGIGRALVKYFAKAGAVVWGLDLDEESLGNLGDEVSRYGDTFFGRKLDVTSATELRAAVDAILAEHRHIDYWFNNAGVAKLAAFSDYTHDEFQTVIDVNLTGPIMATRLLLEAMENRGNGTIVNVASMAGLVPAPFMSSYVAAKHGLVGFSRSLQEELRIKSSPVSIAIVCPGFVDTGIIQKGEALGFPHYLEFMLAKPESVVTEITNGLAAKKAEIYPTLNGKLLRTFYKAFPKTARRSSKILLTKSWKDLFLNRFEMH